MSKKYWITGILILAIGLGIYFFCSKKENHTDLSLENYTPSPEFAEAFNALNRDEDENVSISETDKNDVESTRQDYSEASSNRENSSTLSNSEESKVSKDNRTYDLEETVRILNGMELAQINSESMSEFVEYMARQDYSQVPGEVLNAQKKLFPILEQMSKLDKQYAELGGTFWMVMRSAGSGFYTLASKANASGVGGTMIKSLAVGDFSAAFDIAETLGINQAKAEALNRFEEEKDLEKKLRESMEDVHTAYVAYLSEYMPIYNKYMKQWDEICLYKDKAYLDIYDGNTTSAYNSCNRVLEKDPNNKEAMLLKAMSLVQIGVTNGNGTNEAIQFNNKDYKRDTLKTTEWNSYLIEADNVLDNYLEIYPSRSAPALLIKGVLYQSVGDVSQAMSYYNQSSIEYPRQANQLKDLLDSYKIRTSYLSQSAEGLHLLKLYQSTMEGFGIFSPNFQKAAYHINNGNLKDSKDEVYNHFFRRGNQGIYDCFLSDMEYCEQNLYESFKQMLIEQQYIDVNIEPSTSLFGKDSEATEVNVSVTNRSDINLQNVRIFLCIHFTDMYKDDYHVIKVPSTKNIINRRSTEDLGTVKLDYQDKKYGDITTIRAIAMTDDKICWLDKNSYKREKAQYYYNKNKNATEKDASFINHNKKYLDHIGLSANKIIKLINDEIKVGNIAEKSGLLSFNKSKMTLQFPRILTMIDPVFTAVAEPGSSSALSPSFNVIDGNNIIVKFDFEPKDGETYPFYICSKYLTLKIDLSYKGSNFKIENISLQ